MACYRPLLAYRDREGAPTRAGAHSVIRFGRSETEEGEKLELPCGRCIGCRQDRTRSWSLRCMHEAQLYDSNLFLTLDYSPEKLPASRSLEYVDFQKFMKRLRKELVGVGEAPDGRRAIRFFVAGEYGEEYKRPHWHALLFNCRFPDQVRWYNGNLHSELAEKLWQNGRVVIGDVTSASAAYVAGYTLSKKFGKAAEDYEDVVDLSTGEVTSRRPEFCVMSRRPGIGSWWYDRFGDHDLFLHDHAVQEGRAYKVPRYYWERFRLDESTDPNRVEELQERRYERSRVVDPAENTAERRRVREEVKWSIVSTFQGERHGKNKR
jgi:hypothetical protein